MMSVGKPKLCTNFEVNSFSCCRILKSNPKFWGAPLAQGHIDFFFWWDLMMGLGKLQLHALCELAGSIYYGNIG